MVKKIKNLLLLLSAMFLFYCGQNVPQFDEHSSFSYLEKQMEFGPRVPGSRGHLQCRDWLVSELEKYSSRVVKQDFKHHDLRLDTTRVMTNIIASFNLQSRHRLLLCAHWDSRPFADQDEGENAKLPVPGANDGASGVAVLLEIARLMHDDKPQVGVDIVLFDGEDYGPEGNLDEYFLGSRYFAKNLGTYKPKYGILLDMVGDAQLNLPIEYHSKRYAGLIVNKVWDAAAKLGYSEFEKRVGPAISDDHIQLNQAGIPCVDIIDFQYPDKFHKYWHTLEDTADKCSPQSLKVVGQTLLQVVYSEEG
jgi:Peptidase family M28